MQSGAGITIPGHPFLAGKSSQRHCPHRLLLACHRQRGLFSAENRLKSIMARSSSRQRRSARARAAAPAPYLLGCASSRTLWSTPKTQGPGCCDRLRTEAELFFPRGWAFGGYSPMLKDPWRCLRLSQPSWLRCPRIKRTKGSPERFHDTFGNLVATATFDASCVG